MFFLQDTSLLSVHMVYLGESDSVIQKRLFLFLVVNNLMRIFQTLNVKCFKRG